MHFGNDKYPKWTEKEEMTLIFLAAVNFPQWTATDVRAEINALFGNDRTIPSVTERLSKNSRAIDALADLLTANPVMVAKFWKRKGVVDDLPEAGPVSADPNGFQEGFSGGWPSGAVNTFSAPALRDKLLDILPELDSGASDEDLLAAVRKLQAKTFDLPIRVTRVTPEGVDVDDKLSASQIRILLESVRDFL